MAKNFLDKALNVLGLKSPNDTDYYDPSVYRAEVSFNEAPKPANTTKVERYQRKKNSSSTGAKKLSGVAKYLAEKQQPAQETVTTEVADTEEKLTGVAKYLASKQQEEQLGFEGMTGVAKYFFLKTGHKQTIGTKIPVTQNEVTEKLSRVDLYLAKKQGIKIKPKAITVTSSPKEELKVTPKTENAVKAPPLKTQKTTKKEIIDLSEGAIQCQAATVKRTQCSRKTGLETIELSINQKQYRFAVCNQHNKDSFSPFEILLQDN